MGYRNRCWDHGIGPDKIVSRNHPHLVLAAQSLQKKNLVREIQIQYSGWFSCLDLGLCPFCHDHAPLLDADGFQKRYDEWVARQCDVRYCPSCDLHHPDTKEAPNGTHHISNGLNICSECHMPLVHPDDVPDGAVEKICEANEALDKELGYGPKDNEPVIEYDGNEERATYFDILQEHVPALKGFAFDLERGDWVTAVTLPEILQ